MADLAPRLQHVQIEVACDVNIHFVVSEVLLRFLSAKGATPEIVKEPDACISPFCP